MSAEQGITRPSRLLAAVATVALLLAVLALHAGPPAADAVARVVIPAAASADLVASVTPESATKSARPPRADGPFGLVQPVGGLIAGLLAISRRLTPQSSLPAGGGARPVSVRGPPRRGTSA
jgi:hypothetical protein